MELVFCVGAQGGIAGNGMQLVAKFLEFRGAVSSQDVHFVFHGSGGGRLGRIRGVRSVFAFSAGG